MKVLPSMSIKQLLFDDLEELVLPADLLLDLTNDTIEAPYDPRFQIARKMEAFLSRIGPVIFCHESTSAPATDFDIGLYRQFSSIMYEQIANETHALPYYS